MTLKKLTTERTIIPLGLGIGLLISMLLTIAGTAVCAWLILAERIGESSIGLFATIMVILASAAGAFAAAYIVKKLRLPMCLLSGLCYFVTLLCTTALFFGGQFQGIGIGALAVLAGCVPIAFLPTKNSRVGKWRKKAYR